MQRSRSKVGRKVAIDTHLDGEFGEEVLVLVGVRHIGRVLRVARVVEHALDRGQCAGDLVRARKGAR